MAKNNVWKRRQQKQVKTLVQIREEYEKLKESGQNTYRQYRKSKSSGGYRIISVPSPALKALQRDLLKYLSSQYVGLQSSFSLGFRKGKSITTNALAHRCLQVGSATHRDILQKGTWTLQRVQNKRVLYLKDKQDHMVPKSAIGMDLKDAFGSVTPEKLAEALYETKAFTSNSIDLIVEICTYKDRLPQGAPTSPLMLNITLKEFDLYLVRVLKKKLVADSSTVFTYTRFADDLVISCNKPRTAARAINIVRQAVKTYGFRLNHKKTRLMSVKNGIFVTGINVVNCDTHIGVSRRYREKIRAAIHQFSFKDPQDPDYHEQFNKLMGRINYVFSIDKTHGAKLVSLAYAKGIVNKDKKFCHQTAESIATLYPILKRERERIYQ